MKIGNFIISLILFIACTTTLLSQRIHEIKYNAIYVGYERVELQYEFIPKPRMGLEVALSYDYKDRNLYLIPWSVTNPYRDSLMHYSSSSIGATLKYKRYGKKRLDKGLFYGAYLRLDYHLKTDEQYYIQYERLNSRMPYPTDHTLTGLGIGAHIGYKFVLWEKLIVEGAFGTDYDIQDTARFTGLSLGAIIELKLGYRF